MKTKSPLLNKLLPWVPIFPLTTGLTILFYAYLVSIGTCSKCSALLSMWVLYLAGTGWIATGFLGLIKPMYRSLWLASLLLGIHAGIIFLVPAPPCLYCKLFFTSELVTTLLLVCSSFFELQKRLLPPAVAMVSFVAVGLGTASFLWIGAPEFIYPGEEHTPSPTVYVIMHDTNDPEKQPSFFQSMKQRLVEETRARVFRIDPTSPGAKHWMKKHNLKELPSFVVYYKNRFLFALEDPPLDTLISRLRSQTEQARRK